MCLADLAQVVTVSDDGTIAAVAARGRHQQVLLTMLADEATTVTAGDWLVVHSGLALGRIDVAEATVRRRLLDELLGSDS
jgi:hydrogenase assembly chaperone HypC/HupF